MAGRLAGPRSTADRPASGCNLCRQSRRRRSRRIGVPAEVTAQMVENFAAGGAAINQLCLAADRLKVFDLALDLPTGDITCEAALDEDACAATMAFGMEAVAGGVDLFCIGEMGIGNTTVAAAIFLALFGGTAAIGSDREPASMQTEIARKCEAVTAALAHHAAHLADPLEVLRRLGGREIAAMAVQSLPPASIMCR